MDGLSLSTTFCLLLWLCSFILCFQLLSMILAVPKPSEMSSSAVHLATLEDALMGASGYVLINLPTTC